MGISEMRVKFWTEKLKILGVGGRITDFMGVRVWNGFIWLRIGSSNGLL
jgi:hypothetical protein